MSKRRAAGALAGTLPLAPIKPATDPSTRPHADRVAGVSDREVLTQTVQGQPATDLEERFSRALAKHPGVQNYWFQPYILGGQMLPPDLPLSFAVYAPILTPIQIDGEYPGSTPQALAEAQLKDEVLNTTLIGMGALPIRRLSAVDLADQDTADRTVRDLF